MDKLELNQLVSLKDDLNARIVYEYFNGECFNNQGELVVIIGIGDESGVIIEDGIGSEYCIKAKNLFVSEKIFSEIRKIRFNREDI